MRNDSLTYNFCIKSEFILVFTTFLLVLLRCMCIPFCRPKLYLWQCMNECTSFIPMSYYCLFSFKNVISIRAFSHETIFEIAITFCNMVIRMTEHTHEGNRGKDSKRLCGVYCSSLVWYQSIKCARSLWRDVSRKRVCVGPFIYVLGTRPRQNVLETSSRYTSVQIASTVKCSRYPFRSDLKSTHISVCTVWPIVYTLRNVWGHFNVHSPCW